MRRFTDLLYDLLILTLALLIVVSFGCSENCVKKRMFMVSNGLIRAIVVIARTARSIRIDRTYTRSGDYLSKDFFFKSDEILYKRKQCLAIL